MWKPFVFAALLAAPASVGAQAIDRWSVQGTLRSCEALSRLEAGERLSDAELAAAGECGAFMRGVGTVLVYGCTSKEEGYFPLYVADAPPSTGAAVQAYINWARANPALWGESAVDGIILALMEAFPCTN